MRPRFDGCCVIWPAFGCCVHPKAGPNTFFNRLQPFLFKSQPKKDNYEVPLRESISFCMSTSFEEYAKNNKNIFIFRRFLVISGVKSLKKVWNEQKRWKRLKKFISTSFCERLALESWSKYTTDGRVWQTPVKIGHAEWLNGHWIWKMKWKEQAMISLQGVADESLFWINSYVVLFF